MVEYTVPESIVWKLGPERDATRKMKQLAPADQQFDIEEERTLRVKRVQLHR